jgi:hypothetical protein
VGANLLSRMVVSVCVRCAASTSISGATLWDNTMVSPKACLSAMGLRGIGSITALEPVVVAVASGLNAWRHRMCPSEVDRDIPAEEASSRKRQAMAGPARRRLGRYW